VLIPTLDAGGIKVNNVSSRKDNVGKRDGKSHKKRRAGRNVGRQKVGERSTESLPWRLGKRGKRRAKPSIDQQGQGLKAGGGTDRGNGLHFSRRAIKVGGKGVAPLAGELVHKGPRMRKSTFVGRTDCRGVRRTGKTSDRRKALKVA